MNAQIRSIKIILILAFFVAMIAPLVGCAPAALGAVEFGVEPTPTSETLSYTNSYYGFTFDYPTSWTLTEEDHGVVLSKGSNRLAIQYRWVSENTDPNFGRTGMAAGTPIYSGKISFMDQLIPEYIVELDHQRKYVLYSESGQVELGQLVFAIVLEDLETDYMILDLPEGAINEARHILESFEQIEATGSPSEVSPTTSTAAGAASWTEVVAWLGHIASLPAGSEYDDMVVLSPEGTGEFGLTGATPEIEAEIESLRDAEGPNEYAFLWGALSCGGIDDYNDCQLLVDRLQYGANFSEQAISDWFGTITTQTFNGGPSYVFVLDGAYPMWYSIHASTDEGLQAQIQHYQETGAIVEVSGKLLIGVPDVNGTRIEISSIEPRSMAGPRPDITDGEQYVNTDYGFSFTYPSTMSVEERSHQVVVTRDALQLTIGYRRADESISISDSGPLTGEFHPYTEMFFLGQLVQPSLNINDGLIQGVYLGGPGAELGEGTPMRFVISLVNTNGKGIPNGQVDEILSLFQSFQLSSQ
ncbi:MAG: hypothetical protein WBR18_02345 [Anaerolineales bacterium]